MNRLKKWLIKVRAVKPKPHEKAELGKGTYGRQEATAKPKVGISARVIRKDGKVEKLGRLK